MKSIFTLLVAFALPGWLLSQVSIDTITPAFPGDTIVRYVELAPEGVEITAPGGDQSWTWTLSSAVTQVAVFDSNDRQDAFPFATVKLTEGAFVNYVQINDINWGMQGFVADDPLGMGLSVTSIYEPEFSIDYAPFKYEDTIVQVFGIFTGIPLSVIPDSILETLPIQPDSLRVKVSNVVIDAADAWGTLDINGSVKDVLRQRRETRIAIGFEAKISILPWVDITDLIFDAIDSLPGGISLTDTFVQYRFLAPGYGFPIAEVSVDNDTVQGIVFQAEVIAALKDIVYTPAEINIYPNPTTGDINITLPENDRKVDHVFVVDLTGRMIHSARVSGQELIQFKLDGVPNGMYFMVLIDDAGAVLGTGKVSLLR
jgi:hypothetical protein